jgi:hypothetical protein
MALHDIWGNQKKQNKKTRQGQGRNTKCGQRGGGLTGSTKSKHYKKKYRGQGK